MAVEVCSGSIFVLKSFSVRVIANVGAGQPWPLYLLDPPLFPSVRSSAVLSWSCA